MYPLIVIKDNEQWHVQFEGLDEPMFTSTSFTDAEEWAKHLAEENGYVMEVRS